MALLRGHWYRVYYPWRGVQLQVGAKFHAHGRLRIQGGARVTIGDLVFFWDDLIIKGPGEVIIGDQTEILGGLQIVGPGRVVLDDHVNVAGGSILETQNRHARISIGSRTRLRGVECNCVKEIVIGQQCMIAPATIMDSDFHSIRADRHSLDAPVRVAPVHVSDNVWVADRTALLPGTRIGKNSVVGFGAICVREYPENVVIAGYPARVVATIPANDTDEHVADGPGGLYVPLRDLRGRLAPW
jgi:acetyltransferase-like isoleucine patch superfamily enzyme